MTAFISIEPPGCLKTKFDFDFIDMELMDGSLGEPCIQFFGVEDTAGDDELTLKQIIKENKLNDVFMYDEEDKSALIFCENICKLQIYQKSKD